MNVWVSIGLGLSLLFALVADAQAQPVNIDAAKKEGKLVLYGTVVPQAMEPIFNAFEIVPCGTFCAVKGFAVGVTGNFLPCRDGRAALRRIAG